MDFQNGGDDWGNIPHIWNKERREKVNTSFTSWKRTIINPVVSKMRCRKQIHKNIEWEQKKKKKKEKEKKKQVLLFLLTFSCIIS